MTIHTGKEPAAQPAKASPALEAVVRWQHGLAFQAETGSRHTLLIDTSPGERASSEGPSPMELILVGLAGCTGIDVVETLRKMRQDVTGYEVSAHGERTGTHPRVYARIVVEHRVSGHGLSREKVERAVQLSVDKYCSVSAMLEKTAEITTEITIVEAGRSPVDNRDLSAPGA